MFEVLKLTCIILFSFHKERERWLLSLSPFEGKETEVQEGDMPMITQQGSGRAECV